MKREHDRIRNAKQRLAMWRVVPILMLSATLSVSTLAQVKAPLTPSVVKPQPPVAVPPVATPVAPPPVTSAILSGWVDLHTHPMSQLAFGGKLFHGAPDVGVLMPAVQMPSDPQCRFDIQTTSIFEALSQDGPTFADPTHSICGDIIRWTVLNTLSQNNGGISAKSNAIGAPTFDDWPTWQDQVHQKMWFDWIRRARDGGLRVLVALAHNNRTLAEAVGPGAPISGVTDDLRSGDLQIGQMKLMVQHHADFMEIALSATDVYRIVATNRVAVVLGVELDNLGNLNQFPPGLLSTPGFVQQQIQHLFDEGVRYIFPIHVVDNVFGGTAIYEPLFNWANYRESLAGEFLAPGSLSVPGVLPASGHFWQIECAQPNEGISFVYSGGPTVSKEEFPQATLRWAKWGISPSTQPPPSPVCPQGIGHRNKAGLTKIGETAIATMMKMGMIIDIDHMSEYSVERTLQIAEAIPGGGYPIMSGHNGLRGFPASVNTENSRTAFQLARIACLGGMFGLGTDGGPAGVDAYEWARQYVAALSVMQSAFTPSSPVGQCPLMRTALGLGMVAFGTDTNSIVKSPKPPILAGRLVPPVQYDASFPISSFLTKSWNYNSTGVAHYGLYADFVRDVRTAPANQGLSGADLVDNHLMRSADYFYRMWQKIDAVKANVR